MMNSAGPLLREQIPSANSRANWEPMETNSTSEDQEERYVKM